MKKIKFNSDLAITVGLLLLTGAQYLLSNKKEANAMEQMKKEIKDDILKDLS